MNDEETELNPYQASVSESGFSKSDSKALRTLAHGVYLQLFVGAGILAVSVIGIDIGPFFDGATMCGGLLILLGLNSLSYINRYKTAIRGNRKT